LSAVGHGQRAIGDNGAGLRSRQIGWIDAKPPRYLVLGKKILGEPLLGAGRFLTCSFLLSAR
jgi:hypothetical protein